MKFYEKTDDGYVELDEKDLEGASTYAPFFALCWLIGAIILAIVILVVGCC